jgi:hypothetical protein
MNLHINTNKEGAKVKDTRRIDLSEGKTPTSEEVILAVQKSFEQSVKPALASWIKDVRIIRSSYQ